MRTIYMNQTAGIKTIVFTCRKCGKIQMVVKIAGEEMKSDLCEECEKAAVTNILKFK